MISPSFSKTVFLARFGCALALACASSFGHAADADIVGRYVAKDAEFVIEKGTGNEYRMQYFGKCLREGEPFEFYTNGKARRISSKSFVISVTTSRVPSCARFAPLDGQDHHLEETPESPGVWRFRRTEPSWLTKQAFVREK
ncbi:hypothetical protein [Xylophilus sp. GOD-11R]|uniref:hypothetical protein n=1 Tax=Xylophilus sp. GOD-11R TaxID=3089814 RepID=UPI00298C6D7A|nr:hypothetical protein [Xylophilus sp. GOD-11R]WPB58839.1 hypothetical protein R9X41_09440 [Xylophilus sp. GOD-11R]